MTRLITIFYLLLAIGVAHAQIPLPSSGPSPAVTSPVLSPKAKEFKLSLGSPMAIVKTVVSRISFAWQPSVGAVDGYTFAFGSTPGVYTNFTDVGQATAYTLVETNWPERSVRHYFNVQARSGGQVSTYANEVHAPPYPPDHYRLSWPTISTVRLFWTSGLNTPIAWMPLATVTGANSYSGAMSGPEMFFGSPDARLSITLYNPLN